MIMVQDKQGPLGESCLTIHLGSGQTTTSDALQEESGIWLGMGQMWALGTLSPIFGQLGSESSGYHTF